MNEEVERNLGEQPMKGLLEEHGLSHHDLVAASIEHLTHKMVARACKGRRLTPNVKGKLLRALNAAVGEEKYRMGNLFNY
jgi:hypothetical protein